jgi:hypothetical protein
MTERLLPAKVRSRSVVLRCWVLGAGDEEDREVDVVGEGGVVARPERVGGHGGEGSVLSYEQLPAVLDDTVDVVVLLVDEDTTCGESEEGSGRADDGSGDGGHDVLLGGSGEELFRPHVSSMPDVSANRKS